MKQYYMELNQEWTNEWILIKTFGSMRTNDKTTRGYYIVKCLSELYVVQESIITKRFET